MKYLQSHLQDCVKCEFYFVLYFAGEKKEFLCVEWLRQHILATQSLWLLQQSQQRTLLIYGQNVLCTILVGRWSHCLYVAQFPHLQQTDTEIFILKSWMACEIFNQILRKSFAVLLFMFLLKDSLCITEGKCLSLIKFLLKSVGYTLCKIVF